MIDGTNPHIIHRSGYMAAFFLKNKDVGVNDEWDKCMLSCWSENGPVSVTITDRIMYQDLVTLFGCVYRSGGGDAKQEIKKALGVKE